MSSPPVSCRAVIAFLVFAAAVLFAFLGTTPVTRTQEARVLVVAREMVDIGGNNWLLPRMNGQLRLQKPPLMYWLSASSFSLLGVREFAGRLPSVLAGMALLVVVYRTAARTIAPSAGFVAAASLLGSMLAFRFMRQAETDGLLTLLLTAAIALIWRASDALNVAPDSTPDAESRRSPKRDLLFASICIGLAFLAKGLPAFFALAFFAILAIVRKQPRLLTSWLKVAGPIVVLAIALPWYAYLHSTVGLGVVRHEIDVAAAGETHRNPFYYYVVPLLTTPLPMTPLIVLAVVGLVARCRVDRSAAALIIWMATLIVPLSLIGQKQPHYLVPIMPPMALATAWMVERAHVDTALRQFATRLLFILAGVLLVGGIAVPIVGRLRRGDVLTVDLALAGVVIIGATLTLLVLRRRGLRAGVISFGLCAAAVWATIFGCWSPSLTGIASREVAREVSALGPGPYYFVDDSISVPLLFAMRQIIPRVDVADLSSIAHKSPSLVIINRVHGKEMPPPAPPGMKISSVVELDEGRFEFMTLDREPK